MDRSNYWLTPRQARLSRRRALSLAAAGAGASAFLAACGNKKSSSSASTTAQQAGKPKSGGQFSFGGSDETTFDPSTKRVEVPLLLVYDPLLSIKAGSDVPYDSITVQPGLADKWETPDGQTFTFHLHPGAQFANLPPVNGRALSADDIRFTYEYMTRTGALANKKLPPSAAATMLEGLDKIDTPDPSTVVVHFAQPFAPFLTYAASMWLPILPHEIYDADGDFSKRAVGTGPFQLDLASTQRGAQWTYKKNPTYFRSGLPYLDQVNMVVLADNATENTAFEAKRIDILDYDGLTLDTANQVQKVAPSALRDEYPKVESYYLYIGLKGPPFTDDRVRKALSLSINRDDFIKTFSAGKGEWALAASLPGLFTDAETKQILKYDPAQAKQLLAAAGHPNGLDFDFTYYTGYGDLFVSIAQLLQAQLKDGGFNMSLKGSDHATDQQRRRAGNFQLSMTARGQGLPLELDSYLYGIFSPGAAENFTGVNDPQLTPLLISQRQETDPTKRKQIWRQAIQRINDQVWALALFYGTSYRFRQPYVQNFARNMSDLSTGRNLTGVWVAK